MRCTPLAVWTSSVAGDLALVKSIVKQEVEMTHCSHVVQDAIFVYIVAIHSLLNNPDDNNRVLIAWSQAIKASELTE